MNAARYSSSILFPNSVHIQTVELVPANSNFEFHASIPTSKRNEYVRRRNVTYPNPSLAVCTDSLHANPSLAVRTDALHAILKFKTTEMLVTGQDCPHC
jgi:hypothetical protein